MNEPVSANCPRCGNLFGMVVYMLIYDRLADGRVQWVDDGPFYCSWLCRVAAQGERDG